VLERRVDRRTPVEIDEVQHLRVAACARVVCWGVVCVPARVCVQMARKHAGCVCASHGMCSAAACAVCDATTSDQTNTRQAATHRSTRRPAPLVLWGLR
jgi:hypothetical protein